jgi:hypothetical protein
MYFRPIGLEFVYLLAAWSQAARARTTTVRARGARIRNAALPPAMGAAACAAAWSGGTYRHNLIVGAAETSAALPSSTTHSKNCEMQRPALAVERRETRLFAPRL